MLPILTRIREGERREVFATFATVLSILIAHALLETARDALFLANLPATHLPWMYLALATVGIGVTRTGMRWLPALDSRRALIAVQTVAAAGTLLVWTLSEMPGTGVYYALYIWTGVASMSILVRFWSYLGERFTAAQAKRLFPIIGAGASAGVLIGYSLADALAQTADARALLPASAGFFVLSGFGPAVLMRGASQATGRESEPRHEMAESFATAFRNPYVRRVAAALLLANVTVTIVDFAFKSTVAATVADANLGIFFARAYLAMNVVSLLLLLFAVTPLARRVGVTGTLSILPGMLVLAAVGFVFTGGLLGALLLKGADGALRWSTHKTATELLYVPMSRELRSIAKGFVDVVTLRGGQAIGSALILALLPFTDDMRVFAGVVVAAAGAWLVVSLATRDSYLDLFREMLSRRAVQTRLDFPDLDLGSLETLVAALNSSDDKKVIASIDLLGRKRKGHLVPALILYHPSAPVVVAALDLFAATSRSDILPMLPRLVGHEYAEVRAAALRTSSALRPDPEVLRAALIHDCPVVNVTAIVGLTEGGWKPLDEALPELLRHVSEDSDLARPMIARAIRHRPMPELAPVLKQLSLAPDLESRREAVLAMRAAADPQFIDTLIDLLQDRSLRDDVRESLVELGDAALDALEKALCEHSTPFPLRVHLPRTIVRFQGQRAADILTRHLASEPRGMIRYKSLRALGRLVANDSKLKLDERALDTILSNTVESSFRALHWRVLLQRAAGNRPALRTPSHELLVELLRDKEKLSTERLFRTLGLRYRDENVARIYHGLYSGNPALHSSSRELLESMLPGDLAGAVIALTDDLKDEARLKAAADRYPANSIGLTELLGILIAESSGTLSSIAAYYANDAGIELGSTPVRSRASREPNSFGRLLRRVEGAVAGPRLRKSESLS